MMYWAARRKRDRQRGAVLVELAMVIFPLMAIVLGIVEIGGAWKDKSAAVQASRQGARVVTSSSVMFPETGPILVDQQALLAALAGLPDGNTNSGGVRPWVRKIIIFDAAISDSDMDKCKDIGENNPKVDDVAPRDNSTGLGEGGKCNVYLAGNDPDRNSLDVAFIEANSGVFGGDANGSSWDQKFDPSKAGDRTGAITTATDVGIYVEIYRPYVTGLIPGDGMLVSGETIMRIEPQGL